MNPETNRFEPLEELIRPDDIIKHQLLQISQLVKPDGTPVPDNWITFKFGELVEIKGYTFVVKYIGETSILFEPYGKLIVAEEK